MDESKIVYTLMNDFKSLKRLVFALVFYTLFTTISLIVVIFILYQKQSSKTINISELHADVIKTGKIQVVDGVHARYLRADNSQDGKSTIIDGTTIFMTIDDKKEGISLVNGDARYIAIHDESGSIRLVMGQSTTTDVKKGGTTVSPESNITGFDKNGMVMNAFEVLRH